jgi:N-acyl-D-amino-acid deacylase
MQLKRKCFSISTPNHLDNEDDPRKKERNMSDFIIKGGTVVDGTGAHSYHADIRIEAGIITEIGENLPPRGAALIDAAGCYVTPGFIESHTHYDAAMWWQPDLDPLSSYGTTTTIMGNCGFTLAPLSDDAAARQETVKIFSFFEDIPYDTFIAEVPWDWRSWPEYKTSLTAKVRVPTNYSLYVGHISLRLAVMGLAAWERAATPAEIAKMAAALDEALAAGAMGLSSNLLDHDGDNRPVPTLLAADDELIALFDVMSRYPAANFQVILDPHMRMTAPESLARIGRLIKGRKVRVQAVGAAPLLEHQAALLPVLEQQIAQMQAEGLDVWPGFSHVTPTVVISLYKSLLFVQSNEYVWHEVVIEPDLEKKAALLADPDFRARARASWDTQALQWSPCKRPDKITLDNSDNGAGPLDITLADYAAARNLHPSDALADWFLANGVMSTVLVAPPGQNKAKLIETLQRPGTVGNLSDAGAHLQMLCGAGENILLFTEFVRGGKLTVEQAVHVQTGKLAEFFNLHDRGEIKIGKRADIVVLNLEEIQQKKREKRFDVPNGKGGVTWRFTRQPAPVRLTMVNGVVTFDGKAFTGTFPGEFLAPAAASKNAAPIPELAGAA